MFNSSINVSCINVLIIDDDSVEANETISFQLTAIPVIADIVNFIERQEANIIIEDNDCK